MILGTSPGVVGAHEALLSGLSGPRGIPGAKPSGLSSSSPAGANHHCRAGFPSNSNALSSSPSENGNGNSMVGNGGSGAAGAGVGAGGHSHHSLSGAGSHHRRRSSELRAGGAIYVKASPPVQMSPTVTGFNVAHETSTATAGYGYSYDHDRDGGAGLASSFGSHTATRMMQSFLQRDAAPSPATQRSTILQRDFALTQAEDDKVNVGGGSIKAAGVAPAPVFGFATTHVADSAPADSYGGGLTKSLSALQHELQAVADAAALAPGGVEATLAVLAVSNSSGGFNPAARPPSGRKSFSPGSRSLGFGTGGATVSHLSPSPVSGFGLAAEMAPSGLLSGARPLEALEAEETAMLFEAQVRHAAFRSPGVVSAFRVAAAAHRGQRRLDAEPVLRHCVETAVVLAELGMDSSVVATGLLHDVLDATPVTAAELRAVSGAAITGMVQGVSKLSHVSQISRDSPRALAADERQQLRAMLIAMTDARVVIVKLADRLHCLTTPQHLAPDDAVRLAQETLAQETLARETLAVYVPLASRLGIWTLKARLEDACFACLHPAEHAALSAELEDGAQRAAITVAAGAIATALAGAGITGPRAADVCGRPKSLFSVYRKMEAKGVARVAEIHDVRALRVIVTSEADCYLALAAVHARPGWVEVAGKTKDYVRHAKHNGYQSLHTVVRDEATGDVFEVQIRTVEMHRAAEYGLAAHWRYKESPAAPSPSDAPAHDAGDATFQTRASDATHKAIDEQVAWARFMLSWQGKLADNKCRAEGALDGAGTGGGGGQYAEVCSPCPCPFPTHHAQCHNHEDNLSFGGASAGCTAGMAGVLGSKGEHAAWDSFESPLVSADSASAGLFGSQTQTPLMDHWGDDSFTAAAPIFIIAVVDGVMRMLEVPRGTRLSDVDVTRGGADAGDARSPTVVVNCEAVPPGAEVAVQLRMGDLIEVTHAPGHAGWAECAELGLQAAAAVEKQRVRLGSQFSMEMESDLDVSAFTCNLGGPRLSNNVLRRQPAPEGFHP